MKQILDKLFNKNITIELPSDYRLDGDNQADIIRVFNKLAKVTGEVTISLHYIKHTSHCELFILRALIEKLKKNTKVTMIGLRPSVYEKIRQNIDLDALVIHSYINDIGLPMGGIKPNPSIIEEMLMCLRRISIREFDGENRLDKYRFIYERLRAILNELIGNSLEHGLQFENLDWWFSTEKVDSRSIKFHLLDFGLGVAQSHKLYNDKKYTSGKSDSELVLASLNGEIPSSTGDPNRGKGLQDLKDFIESGYIKKFSIITNSVMINHNNGIFEDKIIPEFPGTYISWIVTKNK